MVDEEFDDAEALEVGAVVDPEAVEELVVVWIEESAAELESFEELLD